MNLVDAAQTIKEIGLGSVAAKSPKGRRYFGGPAVLAAALAANGPCLLAADVDYGDMDRLAKDHGCYICHNVEPRKPSAQEIMPYGPAWKDVAKKYRGQSDAEERLTRIVLLGSGTESTSRHWKGKAAGAAMPANTVEISEADAHKLVRWILSLEK